VPSGVIACALLALGLAAPAPAETPRSTAFSVLTYNVRGLPRGFSFPRSRFPEIARLARKYDLVLTQEVFGAAGIFVRQLQDKYAVQGVGVRADPPNVLLKIALLPFTFFVPDFWPPFGSGLDTFVGARLLSDGKPSRVETRTYRECHGVLGAGMDCFAHKGWLRTGVTAGGIDVDVYNTHLDAGQDEGSRKARLAQLLELACTIDAGGGERPLIVAGDLNLSYAFAGDREAIEIFREHLGLADSGAGPEHPHWRERDYILYRDGAAARLESARSGEDGDFVRDGYALSDHPALFAEFRVVPDASGRRETPAPRRRIDCVPHA
jgi:endonuclease/exonuclease/phosphatase family metal-dependent hydrolase